MAQREKQPSYWSAIREYDQRRGIFVDYDEVQPGNPRAQIIFKGRQVSTAAIKEAITSSSGVEDLLDNVAQVWPEMSREAMLTDPLIKGEGDYAVEPSSQRRPN